MSTLGIAAIQLNAELDDNIDLVEREVRAIAKRYPWVDLVVLGELVVNGPSLSKAEPAGGPTEQRLADLAAETGLWLVPGSLYETRGADTFNTVPVFGPDGKVVGRYDKIYPFLPYETGVAAGKKPLVFDIPGVGRIGIGICYDLWFPEVMRTLAGMGAEIILLPTMTNTIDRDVELSISRATAAVNQLYFVGINAAGDQGFGRSCVYGPGGEVIHEAGAGREVMALDLDLARVRLIRERGWNGLGQVLKSFRDGDVEYPLHADAQQRASAMRELGPLQMPDGTTGSKTGRGTGAGDDLPPLSRLKIID